MNPGDRVGVLELIRREPSDRHGNVRWRVRCVCGQERTRTASDLRQHAYAACGCHRRGNAAKGETTLTHEGVTLTVSQWAKKLGIGTAAMRARIYRQDPQLFVHRSQHHRECDGRDLRLPPYRVVRRIAAEIGCSFETVRERFLRGWTEHEIRTTWPAKGAPDPRSTHDQANM